MYKVFSTYLTWLQASQISTVFNFPNRKQKKHPGVLYAPDLAISFMSPASWIKSRLVKFNADLWS